MFLNITFPFDLILTLELQELKNDQMTTNFPSLWISSQVKFEVNFPF